MKIDHSYFLYFKNICGQHNFIVKLFLFFSQKQAFFLKKLLVFVLVDIDNFKIYNDTYGHQDGDTALQSVAKSLKNTLHRSYDYVFRLGGEEFGLLYFAESEEDALKIATDAKENVEKLKIKHSGNTASKYITISSGLYLIKENDINSSDEIYKKADEALYIAKESGRNKVSIAS